MRMDLDFLLISCFLLLLTLFFSIEKPTKFKSKQSKRFNPSFQFFDLNHHIVTVTVNLTLNAMFPLPLNG